MREIKFKVSNGVEQVIVETIYRDKCDDQIWWALDENDEWFMCSEPRQYTGLKDADGIEIFEGDIVECFIGLKNERYVGVCNFNERSGGFEFGRKKTSSYSRANMTVGRMKKKKIIGNIHQHPNLLER